MRDLNVKKLLGVIAGFVVFAALVGWSVQRDTPQGILIAAPVGACDPLRHGFSTMYVGVLAVAAAMCLMLAAGATIASQLGLLSAGKDGFRSFARSAFVVAMGLCIAMLGKWPIEAMVKQAPETRPGCVAGKTP